MDGRVRARSHLGRGLAPLAALLVAGSGGSGSEAGPAAIPLSSCKIPGLDRKASCGTLAVPESGHSRGDRFVPLNILVVPALAGPQALPDPIFSIAGGPGQAATTLAAQVVPAYGDTLLTRDLVLVDQRGTGRSNPLRCFPYPESDIRRYLGPPVPVEEILRCRRALERGADLTAYTTAAAVEDLEAVRRALGYEKVNLDGGSYGTRVALEYMKRHGDRVRSAILNAVSPAGFRNPLPFPRAGQAALDSLFAACEADAECHRAFPEPSKDFATVLARLDQGPVIVPVTNPVTGRREEAHLSRDLFAARIHLLLLSSPLAARIPFLVHRAAGGDFEPFAQLAAEFGRAIVEQIDYGMQLSVVCSEDVALIKPQDVDRETKGTFLGGDRVRHMMEICKEWPQGRLPKDFLAPVKSTIPTLLISGALDPATPPRFADEVARFLVRGRQVVIPEGSHVDGGACIDGIGQQFLKAGSAESLEIHCVEAIHRPPFFTGMEKGAGARGGSGIPGRGEGPSAALGNGGQDGCRQAGSDGVGAVVLIPNTYALPGWLRVPITPPDSGAPAHLGPEQRHSRRRGVVLNEDILHAPPTSGNDNVAGEPQ
jgi:pimeloyl-ACP methyl ester carboxylesterase